MTKNHKFSDIVLQRQYSGILSLRPSPNSGLVPKASQNPFVSIRFYQATAAYLVPLIYLCS